MEEFKENLGLLLHSYIRASGQLDYARDNLMQQLVRHVQSLDNSVETLINIQFPKEKLTSEQIKKIITRRQS